MSAALILSYAVGFYAAGMGAALLVGAVAAFVRFING